MPQDPNALVWIDLEMTGLNPDTDLIIEIATIVTDANLNILAEAEYRLQDSVHDGLCRQSRSSG